MDLSMRCNGLVIGTGNKSEITVGYCTHGGDNFCAVNPLAYLYKTQIWDLARHLGLPQWIIDKAPSAALHEGQTDEGQLGFLYKELDALAFLMYDHLVEDKSLTEVFGFSASFIDTVRGLHARNVFKSETVRPHTIRIEQNSLDPAEWRKVQ
jgi:NAD+ synthase